MNFNFVCSPKGGYHCGNLNQEVNLLENEHMTVLLWTLLNV